jgi:hypothetical protein
VLISSRSDWCSSMKKKNTATTNHRCLDACMDALRTA